MTRKFFCLALACFLLFSVSGCGLYARVHIQNQFRIADQEGTENAYEQFIRQYSGSRFSGQTMQKAFDKLIDLRWKKAQAKDSIEGYEEFLGKHPNIKRSDEAREKLREKYRMTSSEVDQLYVDTGEVVVNDDISRLVIAGAGYLDSAANWTDLVRGRKVYDILKRTPADRVVSSLGRVVMTNIDRSAVLFLAVKLGTPTTEWTLNGLLMRFGDKSMAEDFLNSGSDSLAQGGRDWAKKHGYSIVSRGFGSHRVRWGSF